MPRPYRISSSQTVRAGRQEFLCVRQVTLPCSEKPGAINEGKHRPDIGKHRRPGSEVALFQAALGRGRDVLRVALFQYLLSSVRFL